jgi:hypothetical protein
MTELPGNVGFASVMTERELSSTRNVAVELLATVALAVSLVIAGTAVSIGMARAQVSHAASHPRISAYW